VIPWSLAEYLDAFWALLLSEGKGGFINYAEYRQNLVDVFWLGKQSEQQQAVAAEAAMGKPAPPTAMEELRAMHEAALARTEELKN
jgi:hypothetical protein